MLLTDKLRQSLYFGFGQTLEFESFVELRRNQDGHCPGNQEKVRENEKSLKWSGKSQGIRERKKKVRDKFYHSSGST